jgi:methyl-accepting chemotaxis protein
MRSLTIKAKLILFAVLGVMFTVFVGADGYWGETVQSSVLEEVVTNSIALRNHMQADMRHEGILADVLAALRAGSSPNRQQQEMATIAQEFARHAEIMRKSIADNQKLVLDAAVQKQMQTVNPALESYINKATAIIRRAAQDAPGAQQDYPDFKASFEALEVEMDKLSDLIEASDARAKQNASVSANASRGWLIFLTLSSMIVLALTSFFIIRSITQPLQRMENYMQELSQGRGDLTRRLPQQGADEIGRITRAFNMFIGQLHDMVVQIKHSAATVTGTSDTLSSRSGDIKRRADQLADRVMQISAATEEMSVSVSEVASSVGVTSTAADQARAIAAKGQQGVAHGVAMTQRMVDKVKNSASGIRELNDSVQKIGVIANAIKEIADQTNLLALNAAIEAARAGEQGRGFAVVADEVRKLAERTTASTADITTTIQQIQGATEINVHAMHEVETDVLASAEYMRGEESTLGQIVSAADEVSRMAGHIASATREQSSAVEASAKGMEQVSVLSEENNFAVAEFDLAAQSLSSASAELQQLVSQFQVEARHAS